MIFVVHNVTDKLQTVNHPDRSHIKHLYVGMRWRSSEFVNLHQALAA